MQERLLYLFGQYLENKCTRKELEEFFGYIRNAEHNERLRQLIRETYRQTVKEDVPATSVDSKGQLVFTEPAWLRKLETPIRRPRRRVRTVLVLALTIAFTAAALWISVKGAHRNTATATVSLTRKSTDRSESKFILLQDSTQVWLNAASALEYPDQFNDKKREVYLTGEAYFDVKHADKIPFIIHTGNVSTTVMGTAFNIKAYPGQQDITVSVSRGKVSVSRKDGWLATLTKGQQLRVAKEGTAMIEKNIRAEGVAAWQQGNILYDDETFAGIIADMERTYNVGITIQNTSIGDLKVSTSFKREIGVEQALQVLCKLTDTELKKADGTYIIK